MRVICDMTAELTDEELESFDESIYDKIFFQLKNGVEKMYPITAIIVDYDKKEVRVSFAIDESQQKQDS